jgi:hypothetical protein
MPKRPVSREKEIYAQISLRKNREKQREESVARMRVIYARLEKKLDA